jgi:hypothetical protein
MHRQGTEIEREVNIYATNLANKLSPRKPMHRIKWRIRQTILYLLLGPSVE